MDTEVMTMGVQAMKHAALLQEWSARIAECRTSGKSVKAWCNEQGIPIKTYYYWEKKFVTEAIQQVSLPSSRQAGLLMQVNPDAMQGSITWQISEQVSPSAMARVSSPCQPGAEQKPSPTW